MKTIIIFRILRENRFVSVKLEMGYVNTEHQRDPLNFMLYANERKEERLINDFNYLVCLYIYIYIYIYTEPRSIQFEGGQLK